ncbi:MULTISPECIES: hypothetical protein [unclassified Sphingobium]|uniref:hypothetical protein n=1 Tax=unclassified Sphingobium TaxID=2611147 RepID=UPI000B2613CA|nr:MULTISPECIES: hypothetical protein [Sphingomonadaceae]NML89896.1 hypothetical protein [Sphingobium sp. TB-6]
MDDADVASPPSPFQNGKAFGRLAEIAPPFLHRPAQRAKNASPREPTTGGFVSLPFGFFEIFGIL